MGSVSAKTNEVSYIGGIAGWQEAYARGKAYGENNISWKPYLAKAVKVSSISTKS